RAGTEIELTATEFELLRFLMRNQRRVVSKAQILDRVWNYDFGGRSSVVELYISYLRKKIDQGRTPLIHTVRGVGYMIKAPQRRPPNLRPRPRPTSPPLAGRVGFSPSRRASWRPSSGSSPSSS